MRWRRDRRRVRRNPRRRRPPVRFERLRQPKVQHLHRAVVLDLDVGGLQVAVDDPLLVRRLQRIGDLFRDRQRLVDPECTSSDPIGERRSLHEFHDERGRAR